MSVRERFERALGGFNYQMIPLHHRWLHTYAQSIDGRPALLVRIDPEFAREVESTRGIGVHADAGDGQNRFLRFQSEERGLSVMFEAVVDSLLQVSATADDEAEALDLLLGNFDELRDMFSTRGGHLSEASIRGLFAEISMLLELREAGFSRIEAVTAWQGPYRMAKDFILPHGRAVEVKSIRRANHRVRIANVDQLDRRGEDLRLAVVPLDRCAPGNGRGLVDIIDEAMSWSSGDPVAKGALTQAVAALGIDTRDDHYERWCFEMGDWRWYSVSDDFPRVRADHVPSAVSGVAFTLDTDCLGEFGSQPFWAESSAGGADV